MGLQFELLQQGEVYMISQGAGGGYGDSLERDPELVLKDFEEELTSLETARDIYKVIIDPENCMLDREATEAARDAERKARLKRGKPYKDFVKQWEKPLPPADVPYYGSWNDRKVIYGGSPSVVMSADDIQPVRMAHPKDVQISKLESEIEGLRKQLASR